MNAMYALGTQLLSKGRWLPGLLCPVLTPRLGTAGLSPSAAFYPLSSSFTPSSFSLIPPKDVPSEAHKRVPFYSAILGSSEPPACNLNPVDLFCFQEAKKGEARAVGA